VLGERGIDIAENFSVHYIGRGNERRLAIDRWMRDHNGDVVGVPNPGESDVELAVGEDRRRQIKGNFLEGLALGLVDGHGEGAQRNVDDGFVWVCACHQGRCSC